MYNQVYSTIDSNDNEMQNQLQVVTKLKSLQSLKRDDLLKELRAIEPTLFLALVRILFENSGYRIGRFTEGPEVDNPFDLALDGLPRMVVAKYQQDITGLDKAAMEHISRAMEVQQAQTVYLITTELLDKSLRALCDKEWGDRKSIRFIDGAMLAEWISNITLVQSDKSADENPYTETMPFLDAVPTVTTWRRLDDIDDMDYIDNVDVEKWDQPIDRADESETWIPIDERRYRVPTSRQQTKSRAMKPLRILVSSAIIVAICTLLVATFVFFGRTSTTYDLFTIPFRTDTSATSLEPNSDLDSRPDTIEEPLTFNAIPISTSDDMHTGVAIPESTPAVSLFLPQIQTNSSRPEAAATKTSLLTRPIGHGRFEAAYVRDVALDGLFNEGAGRWYTIQSVVYGNEQHVGRSDLSGEMRLAWSKDGLYLAMKVLDDHYRHGPDGILMWQGDGIELHFDRLLVEDYTLDGINADDYQIGINFGPEMNRLSAYRWYPEGLPNMLPLEGAIHATNTGYEFETLIPWWLLDIQPNSLQAEALFGLNVSISDNDGDTYAQQTMASASPVRTTFNDPTQWGTLILLE